MDATARLRRPTPSSQDDAAWLRLAPLCVTIFLAAVAAILPPEALRPLNIIGYAVCHRIPERSYFIGAQQLPVCARDTGMFIGALGGLVVSAVVLRTRASHFPARPFAFVLGAFFAAWAFDGFNSYVMLLTRRPLFYVPQNWLRLATGALMGVSLSAYVVALLNQALWHDPAPQSPVDSWKAVFRLGVVAGVVIAGVSWQHDFLYGSLAMLSGIGVLALLTVVNGLIAVILARRHGTFTHWSQVTLAGVIGLLMTILEILCIGLLRASVTGGAGWPL